MRQQLVDLRGVMAKHGVDYCLVPSNDFHGSEYLSSHFKARKWVSGFTGSAGTLLVGKDWAGLWTDGRYFLQAADQLAGSGIDLQKMGEPGVPTLNAYLEQHLKAGQILAFDGRVVSTRQAEGLGKLAEKCGASIACEEDLVGEIWTDRPALSAQPAFELAADVVGKSRAEKLMDLRAALAKEDADAAVIASSDEPDLAHGEKQCSGAYLGQIISLAWQAAAEEGLLPDEFRTPATLPLISDYLAGKPVALPENSDAAALARTLIHRAAKIAAVLTAGPIIRSQPKETCTLVIEGSQFHRLTGFGDCFCRELDRLLNPQNITVSIASAENSCLIGAALAAFAQPM